MSNRNPDINYHNLDQVLGFCFQQEIKNLHTAIPGVIKKYDPATKRAEIQIALNLLIGRVGESTQPESHNRPIVLDVPIIHPAGGGYVVHFPLQPDDAVLLIFNERGIDKFKESFEISDPDIGNFFMEKDAVAIPGFGALEITPAGEGSSFQTEDGEQYIHIEDNGEIIINATTSITAQVGTNNVIIDDGTIEANADTSITAQVGTNNIVIEDGTIEVNADTSVTINAPRITLAGSSNTLVVP